MHLHVYLNDNTFIWHILKILLITSITIEKEIDHFGQFFPKSSWRNNKFLHNLLVTNSQTMLWILNLILLVIFLLVIFTFKRLNLYVHINNYLNDDTFIRHILKILLGTSMTIEERNWSFWPIFKALESGIASPLLPIAGPYNMTE